MRDGEIERESDRRRPLMKVLKHCAGGVGALICERQIGDHQRQLQRGERQQQLRGEIRASVRPPEVRAASSAGADEATIRRVQQLISESEQRHSRELASRLIEFQRDVTMQRRRDLANINSVIGNTVVDYDRRLLQQRQMLNNVMRVSNPQ